MIDERQLQKDIKLYLKTFAETYCKQAEKEITEMAKDAIQRFYDNYTPKYYNRTDDLLNNSYSPYYHNNGKAIYGGVRISSHNMQPYKGAGISEYEIASSAWRKGLHGFENRDKNNRIYSFPPITMVEIGMGNKKFLDRLQTNAENVAEKQQYSILTFK